MPNMLVDCRCEEANERLADASRGNIDCSRFRLSVDGKAFFSRALKVQKINVVRQCRGKEEGRCNAQAAY